MVADPAPPLLETRKNNGRGGGTEREEAGSTGDEGIAGSCVRLR